MQNSGAPSSTLYFLAQKLTGTEHLLAIHRITPASQAHDRVFDHHHAHMIVCVINAHMIVCMIDAHMHMNINVMLTCVIDAQVDMALQMCRSGLGLRPQVMDGCVTGMLPTCWSLHAVTQ